MAGKPADILGTFVAVIEATVPDSAKTARDRFRYVPDLGEILGEEYNPPKDREFTYDLGGAQINWAHGDPTPGKRAINQQVMFRFAYAGAPKTEKETMNRIMNDLPKLAQALTDTTNWPDDTASGGLIMLTIEQTDIQQVPDVPCYELIMNCSMEYWSINL